MADVLKLFLQISLMASVMIGIVLFIRVVLSKKMHPAVMLLLWTMVLVRLCIPFTFISPVKLVNLPQQTANVYSEPAVAKEQLAAEFPMAYNQNPPQTNMQIVNPDTPQTVFTTDTDKTDTKTPGSFIKSIPWWSVLSAIWMAGGIATLFLFIRKAIRFRKKICICHPVTDTGILEIVRRHKQETGIKKPIAVIECDFVHAPAIFGYRKPSILIPFRFIRHMDRNSLDAILLHEMVHIRCHDILMNYAWLAAKALHWFNPLVWIAYKRYEDDVELCRDQQVARRLKAGGVLLYSQSLLEAARFSKRSISIVPSLTTSLFETGGKLKGRISRLMKPQKRSKTAVTLCALLSAFMIITCFTTACRPTLTTVMMTNASPQATNTATQAVKKTFSTNDNRVTVNIDAQATIPKSSGYSVVDIEPSPFTTEFVKKAALVFFEGKTAYAPRTTLTKSQIQAKISDLQQALADPANSRSDGLKSGDPETIAEVTAMFQNRIKTYQRLLPTAPNDYPTKQSDFKFVPLKTYEDPAMYKEHSDSWKQDSDKQAKELLDRYENGQRLILDATLDGGYYGRINVLNYQGQSLIQNTFTFIKGHALHPNESAYFGRDLDPISNPNSISQESALKMANDLMDRLGIKDMAVSNFTAWDKQGKLVDPKSGSEVYVYYVYYQRTYGGVLTTDIQYDETKPIYIREGIQIIIRDDQIVSFRWESPPKQVNSENDVKLLPFDSIMETFTKEMASEYNLEKLSHQAPTNSDYQEYISKMVSSTITVSKIELGMVRLPIKDQPGVYRMVPAWKFYGSEKVQYKDHNTDTSVWGSSDYKTINAIDGSIIDTSAGY